MGLLFYFEERKDIKLFGQGNKYNQYIKNYKNILEYNIPLPCFVFGFVQNKLIIKFLNNVATNYFQKINTEFQLDQFLMNFAGSQNPTPQIQQFILDNFNNNLFQQYTNSAIFNIQTDIINSDNNPLTKIIKVTSTKIFWEEQECCFVTFYDISDGITKQELQQLNNYKDKILANVSHDLRAPLNGVNSMIKQVQESQDPQEIKNLLDEALICTNLGLYMVNDILDAAQIKQGSLKLNIEEFNLDQLINEVLCLYKNQANSKQIKLLSNIHELKYSKIISDKNRLKQILINLIGNSLKFTTKGYILLYVTQTQSNLVQISVKDTGIGISQENIKKLFFRYTKISESYSMNKNGIGLGLDICKMLIEKLGPTNELFVESQENIGAIFTFQIYNDLNQIKINNNSNTNNQIQQIQLNLNLIKESQSEFNEYCNQSIQEITQKSHKDNISIKLKTYSNIKSPKNIINNYNNKVIPVKKKLPILIVDDQTYNIKIINNYLINNISSTQYDIYIAYNGVEAISQTTQIIDKYGLNSLLIILMDCNMPIKNGYQATQEIRFQYSFNTNIKIIGITSYNDQEHINKCYLSGMNDVLIKPFDKIKLCNIINDLFIN